MSSATAEPSWTSAVTEANFDGLPGPTHNYGGLATGNLASARNKELVANPREAALQGLAKMKALAGMGYAQAVLPPHERPAVEALRSLGFTGKDEEVIAAAARAAPQLLAACSSAAAMWAANAATVSASRDTCDGRVHFTPANMVSHFHRALEAVTTTRILCAIFADDRHFVVHEPLPAASQFGDEGAANHTRFASSPSDPGIELFVYGRVATDPAAPAPKRFPARQTREASEAIARRHGLAAARTVFAQQQPDAIDAGVFHNDVIAVGNGTVLFCHDGRCRRMRHRSRPGSSDISIQQPASRPPRRTFDPRGSGRMSRRSYRERIPRSTDRWRRPYCSTAHLRSAPEHA